MATPCLCGQAASAPTCVLAAGPGISLSGGSPNTITALSASAWTAYTPTTTNVVLGNAVNASRYLLVGKTLDVLVAIRFGTTSTYGAALEWELSLPAALVPQFDALFIAAGHVRGRASMFDLSSGSPWFKGEVFLRQTGKAIRIRFGDDAAGSNNSVRSTVPFVWTTSDELELMARLEIV